jgi:hypothetical protein
MHYATLRTKKVISLGLMKPCLQDITSVGWTTPFTLHSVAGHRSHNPCYSSAYTYSYFLMISYLRINILHNQKPTACWTTLQPVTPIQQNPATWELLAGPPGSMFHALWCCGTLYLTIYIILHTPETSTHNGTSFQWNNTGINLISKKSSRIILNEDETGATLI